MSDAINVSVSNFDQEVLEASVPVLVDFYATWCPPCKMLAPHLDQLAHEFSGAVKVVKVNVDDNPQLAVQYQIQHVPSLILFEDGKASGPVPPHPTLIRNRLAEMCIA